MGFPGPRHDARRVRDWGRAMLIAVASCLLNEAARELSRGSYAFSFSAPPVPDLFCWVTVQCIEPEKCSICACPISTFPPWTATTVLSSPSRLTIPSNATTTTTSCSDKLIHRPQLVHLPSYNPSHRQSLREYTVTRSPIPLHLLHHFVPDCKFSL